MFRGSAKNKRVTVGIVAVVYSSQPRSTRRSDIQSAAAPSLACLHGREDALDESAPGL